MFPESPAGRITLLRLPLGTTECQPAEPKQLPEELIEL
ncbi:MAG: hypothetical protein ETSY1_33550 [Candidatus Entotheonella factor]|uniref:Uncharacterized protein n=1 Tax=Entotheonella factor TaxID=1429438 RepID=W4LAL4_ENTF1|nr:MAG: hypothetical protein ETSY1_33550 [Candidatus Entotheonella factor]